MPEAGGSEMGKLTKYLADGQTGQDPKVQIKIKVGLEVASRIGTDDFDKTEDGFYVPKAPRSNGC